LVVAAARFSAAIPMNRFFEQTLPKNRNACYALGYDPSDRQSLEHRRSNASPEGAKTRERKNAGGVRVTPSKGSKRPRESKKIQVFSLAGFGGSVGWLCQAWENLAVIWDWPIAVGDHAKAKAEGNFLRMRPGAPIYE
jgi:hypothetical protein